MREHEQGIIKARLARAQTILAGIETIGFSQKRLLRLDQDITDPVQAAQFLDNYARVGLLKERLLKKVLSAPMKPESAPMLEPEVIPAGELLVSSVAYTFDRESGTLQVGNKSGILRGRTLLAIGYLHKHRGHTVQSSSLHEVLTEAGYQSPVGQTILDVEKGFGQFIIRAGRVGRDTLWALGVLPEEDQGEIISEGTLDGGETTIVAFPSDEMLVIPYEPSEDEVRSKEENKILQFIVDILSRNRNFTFEDLQKAVYSESRIRRLAGGKRQIPIYQASELKDMFVSALRKFREEAAILSLRETWSDDEIELWGNLQLVVRRISGDDWESFSRTTVRARIDGAQRTFYSSLPEKERSRRILWIDL